MSRDAAAVGELVDAYQLWRDSPWYHDVHWPQVTTTADRLLQRILRGLLLAEMA